MDPEEIMRHVQGAILRKPDGPEIGKIDSVDMTDSGKKLRFEIEDYSAGERYSWIVDTQRVMGVVDVYFAADEINTAVTDLYTEDEGYRSVLGFAGTVEGDNPQGIGTEAGERVLDSGSPGPGDPELDL